MFDDAMPTAQSMFEDNDSGKHLLASELTGLLGDVTVFKFHAHGAHWNVKGKDFKEFHAFFGEIYEDAEDQIDTVGELIRQLGYDAPFLLSDLAAFACYTPEPAGSDTKTLTASLLLANECVLEHLKNIFDIANGCREQGIANYIAERISKHQFWAWQLGATLEQI